MPPKRLAGYLQSSAVPSTPLEQIGMELVVAFHKSLAWSKWIIVATDYMTHYAEPAALARGLGIKLSITSAPKCCSDMVPVIS